MFSKLDSPSTYLSEDFARALQLLHSREPSSAEELRALLDASIARRYGSQRITSAKLTHFEGDSIEKSSVCDRKDQSERNDKLVLEKGVFTDAVGNNVGGKDEVPRISIPDEGQIDEAVCKVCNVSEFGQLILIACRECGELYHPLCHQPPVVEAPVHDVDFQWRCSECDRSSTKENIRAETGCSEDLKSFRGDKVKRYSKKVDKRTKSSSANDR